jgi:hypothetical protein
MQRTPEDAMKAVADAEETVVKQGGVIHEDACWDAMEAALDGVSPEVLVETLNGTRKEAYKPKGGWGVAVGRN